jgi:hypothetical protein
MDWSLIIYGDPGMASYLGGQVKRELNLEPVIVENLAAAREQVRKRGTASCKLIVSGLSPALDAEVSSPVDRDTPTALAFLKEVRANDDVPHCVLLVTSMDTTRASALADIRNIEPVVTDGMLEQTLSTAAGRLLGRNARVPPAPLDVDIRLAGATGSWHLFQPAIGFGDNGAINIDKQMLTDLVKLSEDAIKPECADKAAKYVRNLGHRLYQCVLDDRSGERSLSEVIFYSTEQLNSLGNARLRFEVLNGASKIIVETLARPAAHGAGDEDDASGSDDELWSLRLPIFRRASGREGNCPLFKDEASRTGLINCLVIVGETGGFSAGGPVGCGFAALPHANEEIDWLEGYLKGPRFAPVSVTVMRPADCAEGEFAAAVLEALGSRKWQLVHYTGHSQVGKEDDKAYLVLGPHCNDLLYIDSFAQYAADSQFVFLNSCTSANERFVRRLVDHNVPAVAGYAWPIPDSVAATFSKQFYKRLFPDAGPHTRGFIEYSFMHARIALYQLYRAEAQWTAPVLFMQTMNSQAGQRACVVGG